MIEEKKKIVDNFGRPHTYLRISLTDRCNLRCFYCMPEEGIELMEKSNIMTLEEIIDLARTFRDLGVDTIRLTGGEPLVRKNFGYLLEELAKLGVTLKITTNGIMLDKYLDLFQKIGLKKINLSLDTLDKAKSVFITKRDYFDRIWKNIQQALEMDMEVKLNIVLIKGVNDNEINDFIELTKNKKLKVKFIEFMPFKGNKWDWSKGVSEKEILDIVSEKFGKVEELKNPKHSTSNNFKVKGHTGSFSIVSTITNPFCSECNRIRVTADGKMKNCLFANSETDLLTPLRNGEEMDNIIINAIKTKKYSRDGMDVKMDPEHYEKNRSMISIGG
ncbi:cyclic pyranopterin monophosphate synthase subunit MoaA [Christiangramia gaetbulicola]|uniref:GTP 3',8-cyclase n=1 Tax=Christiangramia gaetbulicola TaxID=703340 RepID=A0A2T6ACD0_9FLAO|nr:GTP 3',8-cyclase MoaA [Christiangramia gaetbulicola]PTX41469.1 cyclic pyranopterin monophosphate synthase subunit MoaA [Christiangramia gaetbulicola]